MLGRLAVLCLALSGCSGTLIGGSGDDGDGGGGDGAGGGADGGHEEEEQPAPNEAPGLPEPPSSSLHNRGCGGIDWQLIHGWLLLPHEEPMVAPAEDMARCVERYAGWVTWEADRAGVSRRAVYAALAATGQCDADRGYDGAALLSGAHCVAVNPDLDEATCLARMAASRAFGVSTLAQVLGSEEAVSRHKRDVPAMAAYLATGAVACGGDDRWKIAAPEGFLDRYVAAYNGIKAVSNPLPACGKRIVLTVALYTGMDQPGLDGVAAASGCWTYERVSKSNAEWKICNYDGTVHHQDGVKWVYDDTSAAHDSTVEKNRILACQQGVAGRGYVDMANRGDGWRKVVTSGVRVHFAEIYSSQFAVDDQFSLWQSEGEPGEPMVNFGEPTTSASEIRDATLRACRQVEDGGFFGVYVYPESLRGDRMSALVRALNDCTEP
ncbi:MAG TPA: hypothetical protein VFU21_19390 [Kofleriaceae bacterium]|nr:hypothetical protein [Kofleriaceae bacterium]